MEKQVEEDTKFRPFFPVTIRNNYWRRNKRIPRIKFPQRHPKPSSGSMPQNSQQTRTSTTDDVPQTFFSRSPSSISVAGKASNQPKRTPVSQEEIEAILLGGCN
ncbi:hypothetical protein K7X08_029496 [Anisodus acutangulus]|uniref:Uncharacterized protein n=1 Tax=Anisodus acutangulus TaxID=402998 RepID=A0A9Q1L2T1_9SOLA|nr:hypothetical protein K7X08_029496 [Anisodus acutangulus]